MRLGDMDIETMTSIDPGVLAQLRAKAFDGVYVNDLTQEDLALLVESHGMALDFPRVFVPGDPDHPALAAERAGRERQRYLRLADDVLRGCRSLYEMFVENVRDERTAMREGQGNAPRIGALREARMLSAAIGDGDLVRALDEALAEYGVTGLIGPAREASERLARGILDRQLSTGEASVPWANRGGSREARVRTAETILTAARVGAAVGVDVESEEWVAAISGALMADGVLGERAEKIARHAQAELVHQAEEQFAAVTEPC